MKKTMKRSVIVMLAMVLAIAAMMPTAASAATKKSLAITMKNATITKGKTGLEPKRTSQLTVRYGGKNMTAKATYKSSNKNVVSVSRKGKLTTKKNGAATITVKYKKLTTKLNITVHTHAWKKHYATKTVKKFMRICNCGAMFDTMTEEGKADYYEHAKNHMLAGELSNHWSDTIEKEVKYIDYYYCNCGATKKLK